ncbi:uncharacterized protein TNCV_113441 [Trichonephila clavipes]|nr:uncharacterized protein TNCV_113441 [Trichonephila clavipes]
MGAQSLSNQGPGAFNGWEIRRMRLLTTRPRGSHIVYTMAVNTITPRYWARIECKQVTYVLISASRHGYVRHDAACQIQTRQKIRHENILVTSFFGCTIAFTCFFVVMLKEATIRVAIQTVHAAPDIISLLFLQTRSCPIQDGDRFNSCQVIYSQFGLAIHQNDHQARRRFVEWAQNEIAVVPDFHKRILFSDEAHFWLNGYVNKQNCRILSEANPQVCVETPLHPEKLTVWCALWAGGILLQKR